VIQFDDRTKEKLFMLFVCTLLALSFIYKMNWTDNIQLVNNK